MTHFNWSPKIGDPTIGGWVTGVLYLLAAGSCWITARELVLEDIASNERRAWWAISALFLALGINKQLDLQSALTEMVASSRIIKDGLNNVSWCS